MDYTTLSLADVTKELRAVANDAQATFGSLDGRQLNWKPDATRWSIAQCFQHLLVGDRLMFEGAEHALRNPPRTLWQRIPRLPGLWGRMLIRSQAPDAARKYRAPMKARPTSSEIPEDVVQRFVAQHRTAAEWTQALSEGDAARGIMVSPFISVVTYSVLDGCRLIVAHDRRHFEQARRVLASAEFPSAADKR
jgi:hypothetical protein